MNRYRYYLVLQVLVIVLVILNFKFIEARKVAALVASAIFLGSSSFILGYEYFKGWGLRSLTFWAGLFFLLTSVLPLIVLRLYFWETAFEEIEIYGLRAESMHHWSNKVFMVILAAHFIDSFRVGMERAKLAIKGQA